MVILYLKTFGFLNWSFVWEQTCEVGFMAFLLVYVFQTNISNCLVLVKHCILEFELLLSNTRTAAGEIDDVQASYKNSVISFSN